MDKRVIIAFLVLGTVACTKEFANNQSGQYKVEFRANHPEIPSKIDGMASWVGDGTEKIAITLTQDEEKSKGIYTVKSMSGITEAETPALWQSTKTKATITAIYPASLKTNSMKIRDQSTSEKFKQCDILTATETNVSFSNSMALDFKHAMELPHGAKVKSLPMVK